MTDLPQPLTTKEEFWLRGLAPNALVSQTPVSRIWATLDADRAAAAEAMADRERLLFDAAKSRASVQVLELQLTTARTLAGDLAEAAKVMLQQRRGGEVTCLAWQMLAAAHARYEAQ